jgi:hypothetical protein
MMKGKNEEVKSFEKRVMKKVFETGKFHFSRVSLIPFTLETTRNENYFFDFLFLHFDFFIVFVQWK